MAKTKDALEILERVTGDDAQLREYIQRKPSTLTLPGSFAMLELKLG